MGYFTTASPYINVPQPAYSLSSDSTQQQQKISTHSKTEANLQLIENIIYLLGDNQRILLNITLEAIIV